MALLDRQSAQEYASWFRALADPTRVQLVEFLARSNRPMSVGELVAEMGLAQSTVSQHLKVLAEVRFVLVLVILVTFHRQIPSAAPADWGTRPSFVSDAGSLPPSCSAMKAASSATKPSSAEPRVCCQERPRK